MARILTGIQSSGRPHLGNLLGAIIPGVKLSQDEKNEAYFFIADLHSLTTIKEARVRQEYSNAVAAAWLACGFDTDKNVFYRQSRVPEVCELAWHLSCFTPYPMLANALSFKDKADRLSDVNAGLFTYPVLQTADIILYNAHFVPVGQDQRQHLEMARDIAEAFNNQYGETFVVPQAQISEDIMTIPGTDGHKMSKSYNNTIDVFLPEKELRKQVMSIITDSTPLEEPKNPDTCTVFRLYSLVAGNADVAEMRANYLAGGYGHGHAKQELFVQLLAIFAKEREIFNYYLANLPELDKKLREGEDKARLIAQQTLVKVRLKLGFA